MFAQAYRQLAGTSSSALRTMRDSGQDKLFEITFEGEQGIDAGGVYREGLQRILDDLFNEDAFNLCIPCPNNRKGYKVNTGAYMPNPAHCTGAAASSSSGASPSSSVSSSSQPLALSMFEFVGRLMGMSLRTKAALPFAFTSLVWKGLCGDATDESDLAALDAMFASYLSSIRHCDRDASMEGEAQVPVTTESEFSAAFPNVRWTVINAAGLEVELVPGGSSLRVTFATRHAYCDAALSFRLHECDDAIAAMRRGLSNLVPLRGLSLFTWTEVEALICGQPTVDIALLRKHTRYDGGYTKDHAVVKRFWQVLSAMSQEDRSKYVRFAWGRARLPPEGAHWTSPHTITRLSGGDAQLPMAHTCFFTLDLPEYTSDERMAWGLSTAMMYGIGGILNG